MTGAGAAPQDSLTRLSTVCTRTSSSPRRDTLIGTARLAQLVEHCTCNAGVGGSSPPVGFGMWLEISAF